MSGPSSTPSTMPPAKNPEEKAREEAAALAQNTETKLFTETMSGVVEILKTGVTKEELKNYNALMQDTSTPMNAQAFIALQRRLDAKMIAVNQSLEDFKRSNNYNDSIWNGFLATFSSLDGAKSTGGAAWDGAMGFGSNIATSVSDYAVARYNKFNPNSLWIPAAVAAGYIALRNTGNTMKALGQASGGEVREAGGTFFGGIIPSLGDGAKVGAIAALAVVAVPMAPDLVKGTIGTGKWLFRLGEDSYNGLAGVRGGEVSPEDLSEQDYIDLMPSQYKHSVGAIYQGKKLSEMSDADRKSIGAFMQQTANYGNMKSIPLADFFDENGLNMTDKEKFMPAFAKSMLFLMRQRVLSEMANSTADIENQIIDTWKKSNLTRIGDGEGEYKPEDFLIVKNNREWDPKFTSQTGLSGKVAGTLATVAGLSTLGGVLLALIKLLIGTGGKGWEKIKKTPEALRESKKLINQKTRQDLHETLTGDDPPFIIERLYTLGLVDHAEYERMKENDVLTNRGRLTKKMENGPGKEMLEMLNPENGEVKVEKKEFMKKFWETFDKPYLEGGFANKQSILGLKERLKAKGTGDFNITVKLVSGASIEVENVKKRKRSAIEGRTTAGFKGDYNSEESKSLGIVMVGDDMYLLPPDIFGKVGVMTSTWESRELITKDGIRIKSFEIKEKSSD